MARHVKRVPLYFDAPLGEVWSGYRLPSQFELEECSACQGAGTTPAYNWLLKLACAMGMLAGDHEKEAVGQRMHPYVATLRNISYGHMHHPTDPRPGKEFARVIEGLTGGETDFGPFGMTPHHIAHHLIGTAGLPRTWGHCEACKGEGEVERYPGQRADKETWEPSDPPEGPGWQLWETTSAGSPITPVFKTPEDLAEWCVRSHVYLYADIQASYQLWLDIILGKEMPAVEVSPGWYAI